MNQAEFFRISFSPFKIVEQTPMQIAAKVDTLFSRLMHPFERFPEMPAAATVENLFCGVTVLGHHQRLMVLFPKYFKYFTERPRAHSPSKIRMDGMVRARIGAFPAIFSTL